jgi:glycosyltransferase involved in cell wall biosynthesis
MPHRHHLLADEALRQSMAQEGLRTAALYSWGRVAEQVLSYYREVAGA